MSNAAKFKKRAAEFELQKQFDKAVASYVRAIEVEDAEGAEVDVAVLNKVGDLTLRLGRVAEAVTSYERAVEHYTAVGLFNNAIALCNKILRHAPGRAGIYLTLGRVCARKGMRGDATRNFLEYAARLKQEGRTDEAMHALAEVASLMPELEEVRRLVEEHAERAGISLPAAVAAESESREGGGGRDSLVFLDIDYDSAVALTPPLGSMGIGAAASPASSPPPAPSALTTSLDDLLIFDPTSDTEPLDELAPLPGLEAAEPVAFEGDVPSLLTPDASLVITTDDASADGLTDALGYAVDEQRADVAEADALEGLESDDPSLLQHAEARASSADPLDAVRATDALDDVEVVDAVDALESSDAAAARASGDAAELAVVDTANSSETTNAAHVDDSGRDNADSADAGDRVFDAGAEALVWIDVPMASDAPRAGLAGRDEEELEPDEHDDVEPDLRDDVEPDENVNVEPDEHVDVEPDAHGDVEAVECELPTMPEHGSLGRSDLDPAGTALPVAEQELAPSEGSAHALDLQRPDQQSPHEASRDAIEMDHVALFDFDALESLGSVAAPDNIDSPSWDARSIDPATDADTSSDDDLQLDESAFDDLPLISDELELDASDLEELAPPSDVMELDASMLDALARPSSALAFDAPTPDDRAPASDELGLEDVSDVQLPIVSDELVQAALTFDDTDSPADEPDSDASSMRVAAAMAPAEAPAPVRSVPRLDPHDFILPGELPPILVPIDRLERAAELVHETVDRGGDKPLASTPVQSVQSVQSVEIDASSEPGRSDADAPGLDVDGFDADDAGPTDDADTTDDTHGVDTDGVTTVDETADTDPIWWNDTTSSTLTPEALDGLDDVAEGGARISTPPVAFSLAQQRCVRLRDEVEAHPGDWARRRRLAEALLEAGELQQGLEELAATALGHELEGALAESVRVLDDVVRVAPEHISYHQKRVELAVRLGDKDRLRDSYLDLADALVRSGHAVRAEPVYVRVLELDPWDDRARAALGEAAPPPPSPKPPAAPADDGYVNLADWLSDDAAPHDTRMRVKEPAVTGDEDADFDQLLQHFRDGVARSLGEDDYESHYDLGVAYKEMGLLDDAVAEFQRALRSPTHRLPAYEALGQCFLEQGSFPVAVTVLSRALHEPGLDDEQRVGVLYLLGYACEALQRRDEARSYFQRVYATDIHFRDVAERLSALDRGTR